MASKSSSPSSGPALTPEALAPGVWRLPLPSRTLPPYNHTNSYVIVSGSEGLLIDLGSDDDAVLEALWGTLLELGIGTLSALLLTHTHPDHCAGVSAFQVRFGAPVCVHPLEKGRLEATGPVRELGDGQRLTVGETVVQALHTPGHSPGHLSFWLPQSRVLLVGDLLAAHGSTWVGVPEGDVAAYLTSLTHLAEFDSVLLAPGHGAVIHTPQKRLLEVQQHRLARETEVLEALREAPLTVSELRARVYLELPLDLVKMAESSLLAHLAKLEAEGRVVQQGNRDSGSYAIRT